MAGTLSRDVPSRHEHHRDAHAPDLNSWIDRDLDKLPICVMTVTEMSRGVLKLSRKGDLKRTGDFEFLLQGVLPVGVETAYMLREFPNRYTSAELNFPIS